MFNYANPLMWIELGISIALLIFADVFVMRTIKRKPVRIYFIILTILVLLLWAFNLTLAWALLLILGGASLVIIYTINVGVFRPYVSNSLKNQSGHSLFKKKNKGFGPIFDKEGLYDKIEATVKYLSRSRIGALITFERNVELTDFARTGTILNAPVSQELLVTIFYPGTRLHDGAVIIRRDEIYAAACYYDPITSGLSGKYGSRHRAALGISKTTDSVTIVVSEETGRISLAVAGELIHVSIDDFRRLFEEYMASEVKPEEEK